MIKITDIKKYPRIKGHFKIFFDNDTSFIIDPDTIVKYNLHKDLTLDDNKLQEIIKNINSNSIMGYSLYLISNKSYSAKSLQKKLEQKGYFEEDINKVILRFTELGYINDLKFAQNLVQYLKSKNKGPLYIKNELLKNSIDKQIIEDLLTNLKNESEPFLDIIDIIKKKFPNFDNNNDDLKRKIAGFLLRRGFLSEDIYKAFRNYKNNI